MIKPTDTITYLKSELEFEPCHDINELEPETEAELTRSLLDAVAHGGEVRFIRETPLMLLDVVNLDICCVDSAN